MVKAILQNNMRPYVYIIRELNNLIWCSYLFRPAPRIIHLVYGVGIRINPVNKIKRGELVETFRQYVGDFGKDAIMVAVSDKLPAARSRLLQDLKQVHVTTNHIDGSDRLIGHKLIQNSGGFGYQIGTSSRQEHFVNKGLEFGYTAGGRLIYGKPALITDQAHSSVVEDWDPLKTNIICEFYHKLLSGSQKSIEVIEFSGLDVVVKFINVDDIVKKYGVPKLLFDIPYIDKDIILAAKTSGSFNKYFSDIDITSL